jgi:DNA polymerase-3 subunit epsilon
MAPRLFLILCFAALAISSLLAVGFATWLIQAELPETGPDITNIVIVFGGGLAFLLVAVIAVLWAYLDHAIAQPLSSVLRGVQTVLHANPDHRIVVDDFHLLGGLPAAVNELVRQLAAARTNVEETVATATARVEEQKNRLGTVLQDLHEGVIVCTMRHRILLYNTRALEILHIGGDIGLDRTLFTFMTRQPVLHAIDRLTNRIQQGRHETEGIIVPFVGSSPDGRFTLEGRLSLIIDADEQPTGYVLSFEDKTEELAMLGLRDKLTREATEGLRGTAANLRAAAEILTSGQDLAPEEAANFGDVVMRESEHLCQRLEALSAEYRNVITGHWPMNDIYSTNLIQTVSDRLREQHNIATTMTGIPVWLHADSYTLAGFLVRLILRISQSTDCRHFDLEAAVGEKHVYLDVIWTGTVIPAAELSEWQTDEIEQDVGGLTLREVLERHKTDVWSLSERDERARIRIPLPPAHRPREKVEAPRPHSRPEFYDFDLIERQLDLGALGAQPLRSLNFVVFDTETTGLDPSGGDEIISIAGIRLVNGRILTGESFERLVDPQRPIPPGSTKFHGITSEMVKDKPPIEVVLPQFRDCVGDAILVAHNAAFDLKFLKLKEGECGVTFDNPVLDTLLLSVYVHDHTNRHTLDAVAQRFGIPIYGRHTAMGDSVVTAGVFLKMIDLLEARGVETLDQAIAASKEIVAVRAQQEAF